MSLLPSSPTSSLALFTLIALASGPLAAADLMVNDLRFAVGQISRTFNGASTTTATDQSKVSTTTTSETGGRDAGTNWRGQLQYVRGNLGTGGGLIYGVGLAVNHATWDNGDFNAHATSPTVDVLLGYGYGLTSAWHFEITPFAGYGRTYYSISQDGSSDTGHAWENYMEYGAKAGTYVELTKGLVLGIEVPYMVGRFDPKYEYSDTNNDQVAVSDKRSNEGFGALLCLGGRF